MGAFCLFAFAIYRTRKIIIMQIMGNKNRCNLDIISLAKE